MQSTQQQFDLACEEAKNLIKDLNDNLKLELYGNFKQATIGDNTTSKPGMFSLKEKAKWEAWNKNVGVSADQAKLNYIKIIKANSPPDVAKNFD